MTKKVFTIEKVYKWSKAEDKKLLELAKSSKRNDWLFISTQMKNKPTKECKRRFKIIRTDIKKGYWSKEEDEKLKNLYSLIGPSWAKIAKLMKNRDGKQVRDRYINTISESLIKSKFSDDEDFLLFLLQKIYGNKWTMFTCLIKNRSPDSIKNRFNTAVKNRLNHFENLWKKVKFL